MESKDSSLSLPPPEKLRDVAAKQDARAKEIRERRAKASVKQPASAQERSNAAALIQRNYRGHRERGGLSMVMVLIQVLGGWR